MNGTTVWGSLVSANYVVNGIVYIDASTLQPTVDPGTLAGNPSGGGLVYVPNVNGGPFAGSGALLVSTSGDLAGTDPINSGGQVDSYIPTTLQNSAVNGKVPGFTVSTSRGTRYIPAVVQDADLCGEFAGYGYISSGGVKSYAKLAGLSALVAGNDANFPGGELRFGTRPNAAGVFTDWWKLDNAGAFAPVSISDAASAVTPQVSKLGKVGNGVGKLNVDYFISVSAGNATINKMAGQVTIAAGAVSLVITNSLITANSLVFAQLASADATLTFIKSVVPAAGSVTITGNANATANTKVNWFILNTDS